MHDETKFEINCIIAVCSANLADMWAMMQLARVFAFGAAYRKWKV
jgi:hypothetical protein